MTTIGDKFRSAAVDTIEKFTAEFGFSQLLQLGETSSYNPDTGEVAGEYDDYEVKACYYTISDNYNSTGSHKSVTQMAAIAGASVSIYPRKNDVLVDPDGNKFVVKEVSADMYKALYELTLSGVNQNGSAFVRK